MYLTQNRENTKKVIDFAISFAIFFEIKFGISIFKCNGKSEAWEQNIKIAMY